MNAVPKPEPRKRVKARQKRHWQRDRNAARAERYQRDGGCCVTCGKPLKLHPSEARYACEIAHLHEERPRSLGGDPLNPNAMITLCHACHRKAHRQ